MIDHSNYSCDKCKRVGFWHCKHCWHTADKPPTRFKSRTTMKLKEKLKNWLFKEELNDIQELKDKYDALLRSVELANAQSNKAQEMHHESQVLLENCHKLMNSICDVGVDAGYHTDDHSWAVICVHGKIDYVKFVDMRQSDIRTIVEFLKHFKYSNMVTDSPLVHQGYLKNEILRW